MPVAWASFAAGDISLEHARVIGTTVAEMKPEKKDWAERLLTRTAPAVEPLALDRLGRQLRYELDPDTADERAKKQHDGRRLSVATTFGGMVSINGLLGPVPGAIVQAALDAFMAPHGPQDTRTAPQRRADSLEEICQRILRTDQPPTGGGHRPQILVRTGLAGLAGLAGLGSSAGLDSLDRLVAGNSGPADLDRLGPLARADLQRLACDAELVRVVFAATGEILDVGRAQRTFPIGIRRGLLAQWSTCFWPGCRQPAQWAEGHHVKPWEVGGETSLGNAVLACAYHHHVIHRDSWQLEKLPDGTIVARLGPKQMVCKPNAP
jgi:hypothetical protein